MPKPTPSPSMPDTEFEPDAKLEKRSRRVFSAAYKQRIVAEASACAHGELGELLRRENLYSNQISQWRRELAEDGEAGLSKSAPGPRPKCTAEQRGGKEGKGPGEGGQARFFLADCGLCLAVPEFIWMVCRCTLCSAATTASPASSVKTTTRAVLAAAGAERDQLCAARVRADDQSCPCC